MDMIDKVVAVAKAIVEVVGALSLLAGVLANVLPQGKWKTAASYIGIRLLKAKEAATDVLPKDK